MQAHEFAVGRGEFVGDIGGADIIAEQRAGNRERIEFVGLGAQATAFRKVMGLGGMEEDQAVSVLVEVIVHILPIASGRFQANHHLLRWTTQLP